METTPLDSQDELFALRAQLDLFRHRQHGPSSEKIDRKIEQFELMLEEIEVSRAEAEMRSGKTPLPELDDAPDKPKRKPLPDDLPIEEVVYAPPCSCPACGGTSFLKAADKVVQVMEHVLDLSRFDAAPLIAFTATKETNYGTETDGRISPRCGTYRADQWAYT